MLSEYTLKAIDIVCGEDDTYYKEQVTKNLEGFYKRMQEDPIDRSTGLCHNLWIVLRRRRDLYRLCDKALLQSFELAGLRPDYPFNYCVEEAFKENPYTNPNRLAWVDDNNV